MKNYEGVFIVDAEIPADDSKKIIEQVQELISKNGGRIDGITDWGKKRMAYKINKKQDGIYTLLNFQIEPEQCKKVEQVLRLSDNLLRFMILKKDS